MPAETREVRFLRGCSLMQSSYQAGETASFPEVQSRLLVDRGFASYDLEGAASEDAPRESEMANKQARPKGKGKGKGKGRRAHEEDGTFKADDPATPGNEAFEQD